MNAPLNSLLESLECALTEDIVKAHTPHQATKMVFGKRYRINPHKAKPKIPNTSVHKMLGKSHRRRWKVKGTKVRKGTMKRGKTTYRVS